MSNDSDRVWTVLSMLEWGTDFFTQKKIDSPRLSIEWLLAHVLDIKRLDIYLQYDRPLSQMELDRIRPLVKRRSAHEPLQHITGSTNFMGCTIHVNPDVLIPRTETEQLVELILGTADYRDKSNFQLLDIGTGSGCIPIAIKTIKPNWNCTGIDISENALNTAKKNALLNNADIQFTLCDLNVIQECKKIQNIDWDIVVSNPPYITPAEKSSLDPQVINFEPALALFHEQPIELYKKISSFAAKKNADLFLECNDKFIDKVKEVVNSLFQSVKVIDDYDGNRRFIVGKTPSK
jgi:release factor glutamine methyltransferase